jgi:hypothetical protein
LHIRALCGPAPRKNRHFLAIREWHLPTCGECCRVRYPTVYLGCGWSSHVRDQARRETRIHVCPTSRIPVSGQTVTVNTNSALPFLTRATRLWCAASSSSPMTGRGTGSYGAGMAKGQRAAPMAVRCYQMAFGTPPATLTIAAAHRPLRTVRGPSARSLRRASPWHAGGSAVDAGGSRLARAGAADRISEFHVSQHARVPLRWSTAGAGFTNRARSS